MINTINTKQQQLQSGYFKTGSGSEVILVIGSCRSVPYLNYFEKWNNHNGNRFTICFADPFNFNYDLNDNRIDMEAKINSLETDKDMLDLFKSTKYFIHEYYANFGMFNCDKNAEKNIYQFGMNPQLDICIPNWNGNFILFADIVSFDVEMRKKAISDYNVIGKLSDQTIREIEHISWQNIEKFIDVCLKSSIPEMASHFLKNYREKRFFWTNNHVAKNFTTYIFDVISQEIGLNLSESFYDDQIDLFANNYVFKSEYDDFDWEEQVVPLKNKLF